MCCFNRLFPGVASDLNALARPALDGTQTNNVTRKTAEAGLELLGSFFFLWRTKNLLARDLPAGRRSV